MMATIKLNSTRPRIVGKCHNNKTNPSVKHPIVQSPRFIELKHKADKIKNLMVSNDDPFVDDELMKALSKVNESIKEHLKDPIAFDYCIIEPWCPECRWFD
jgi:hypothetical protein